MPGFDGTGPGGMGALTGGGRGFCGNRGMRGAGRGRGAARAPAAPYTPNAPSSYGQDAGMSPEQEMEFLRSQAQAMSEQLEQIQKRLQELKEK